MGANPHSNGGLPLKALSLPDFRQFGVDIGTPGAVAGESTRIPGLSIRDVMKLSAEERNFRIFGPDETEPNRLAPVFEETDRIFTGEILASDPQLSRDRRCWRC